VLLRTICDVQLHGYAFGEWRCVFIVYVVLEMQSHFRDMLSFNVISITYVIVKSPQNEPPNCCMTFAYVYSKCSTLIILVSNCTVSSSNFLFSMCLNHILCNANLVWLCVFGLRSNDFNL